MSVHEDPPSEPTRTWSAHDLWPPAGCTQRSSSEAEANGRCCLRLSHTMTVVTEKLRLGNSKMVSFIDWSLQHDMWHRQSKERRTVVALKQQQANLVAARAQNWQRVFYESHQCSRASAFDVFGTPAIGSESISQIFSALGPCFFLWNSLCEGGDDATTHGAGSSAATEPGWCQGRDPAVPWRKRQWNAMWMDDALMWG